MNLGRSCLQNMKKKNEKALFIHRLGAFIIDVFLVSCIASLISYPFLDSKSINKLNDSATELIEKYTNDEIDIETYTDEVKSVTYELAKKQGASSLITITLTILYFVVYQYKWSTNATLQYVSTSRPKKPLCVAMQQRLMKKAMAHLMLVGRLLI